MDSAIKLHIHPLRRALPAATLIVLLLTACAARPPALRPAEDLLPAADAVLGWRPAEKSTTYDRETLYAFMDGAADLFFTYGFQELAVGRYAQSGGDVIQIEVYRVDTDADAYGLYTYYAYGTPVDLGVDGRADDGRWLIFWQQRTFVQLTSRDGGQADALRALAKSVADALPKGGQRPALLAALPAEGLQPDSVRFFRAKMALDNFLWIGPDDVLGLTDGAEGIVAHYRTADEDLDLMLVSLPDDLRAQSAREGLEGAGIENLAATAIYEQTLVAVFGPSQSESVQNLIDESLSALRAR
jgi:hypothetical protein